MSDLKQQLKDRLAQRKREAEAKREQALAEKAAAENDLDNASAMEKKLETFSALGHEIATFFGIPLTEAIGQGQAGQPGEGQNSGGGTPPPPEGEEDEEKSGRGRGPHDPPSPILAFTYGSKIEAHVFIMGGAQYSSVDPANPQYRYPEQFLVDAQGNNMPLKPGQFILPPFLEDAGRNERKLSDPNAQPTVFTSTTASRLRPPKLYIGEFSKALDLPYTWTVFLLKMHSLMPCALRMVESVGKSSWRLTDRGWTAVWKRDVSHTRALAVLLRSIVRTEFDPNAHTEEELKKKPEHRVLINKEYAVNLAKKVRFSQDAIDNAYKSLGVKPEDQDPPLQDDGVAQQPRNRPSSKTGVIQTATSIAAAA